MTTPPTGKQITWNHEELIAVPYENIGSNSTFTCSRCRLFRAPGCNSSDRSHPAYCGNTTYGVVWIRVEDWAAYRLTGERPPKATVI